MGEILKIIKILQIFCSIVAIIALCIIFKIFLRKKKEIPGYSINIVLVLNPWLIIWSLGIGLKSFLEFDLAIGIFVIATFSGTISILIIFFSSEMILNEVPRLIPSARESFLFGMLIQNIFEMVLHPEENLDIRYIENYGWTFSFKLEFIIPMILFLTFSICSVLEIFLKTSKLSNLKKDNQNIAKLLTLGLLLYFSVISVAFGTHSSSIAIVIFPSILLIFFSMSILLILNTIKRNPGLLKKIFSPNKVWAIFMLDLNGVELYHHIFDKKDFNPHSIKLITQMFTAINDFINESIEIDDNTWIQEIQTDDRIFRLKFKKESKLIGVLIVDNFNNLLKYSLKKTLDDFSNLIEQNKIQPLSSTPINRLENAIIRSNFAYLQNTPN